MKITLYNFKGGVGKTSIACNLALSLNYAIVTNDIYSPLEMALEEKNILKLDINQDLPEFPKDYNLIFDLGGYIDTRAIKAIEQSDYVLIPTTSEFKTLQTTLHTIEEIQSINKNIVIIANATKSQKDFDFIKEVIENKCGKFPIFNIKFSKALDNVFLEKQSIKAMTLENGLKKYHYQSVALQFEEIIQFINK